MNLEYTSSYFIMIPTGKIRKTGSGRNGEENSSPLFNPLPPFPPVSILVVLIISIGSEEVLWNLELLIHTNTHSKMEINL